MKQYLKILGISVGFIILFELMQFIFIVISYAVLTVEYIINHGALNVGHIQYTFLKNAPLISIIGDSGLILAFIIIYSYTKKGLIKRCKFKSFNFKYLIYIVILILGVSFFIDTIINIINSNSNIYFKAQELLLRSNNSLLGILITVIIIPILEEIIFRGIVFNEIRDKINIKASIIFQALIFCICYMDLVQGLYAFILGVVLGYIYKVTNSLWCNIIAHILFNIFGGFLIPLVLSFTGVYKVLNMILGISLMLIGVYFIYRENKNIVKINN